MIIDVVDPATGQRYIYIADHDDQPDCHRPSTTSYTNGCRCNGCREARRSYEVRRRRRLTQIRRQFETADIQSETGT